MSELIDTTEMYLRTIFELEEEGIIPLRARIAERLRQSGPTVSQTVARMERDGLLHVSDDRHIELSETGRQRAMRVMRKHRLAERLLTDVIGLDWPLVHIEACRWEHVISDAVEERLVKILPETGESPYGNPIPGLNELGLGHEPESFRAGTVPLDEAVAGVRHPVRLQVRRISENLQSNEELLARLIAAGVMPGAELVASAERGGVRLVPEGSPGGRVPDGSPGCILDTEAAGMLFVVTR